MNMSLQVFVSYGLAVVLSGVAAVQVSAQEVITTIPAIPESRTEVLVHVPLETVPQREHLAVKAGEESVVAQVGGPWLLDDPKHKHWLTFVIPSIEAGKSVEISWSEREIDVRPFQWSDDQKTLSYRGSKTLSLEDEAFDDSSPEKRDLTYKVFHHVYLPRLEQPITKGPGGLFPHHRGLFFGFNKIGLQVDGKNVEVDTWHAKKAHQESRGVDEVEDGPVFGRQVLTIGWMNEATQPASEFATEKRELLVFRAGSQLGIQFSSRLSANVDTVSLKGDPQHAGFQFRASQEVAESTKDQTYYLRPDGVDKPGSFRNWPEVKTHVDLPFHGMSFVVGGRRVTCLRLDRPENPHPARFSERDYGRFGCYFEYDLTPDKPLELKYQLRFMANETTVENAESIGRGFYGENKNH